MTNFRREINRFKVKDENGNDSEVIEFKANIIVEKIVDGSTISKGTMPSEYELLDGTPVFKVKDQFQTTDAPIPQRFHIV